MKLPPYTCWLIVGDPREPTVKSSGSPGEPYVLARKTNANTVLHIGAPSSSGWCVPYTTKGLETAHEPIYTYTLKQITPSQFNVLYSLWVIEKPSHLV